MSDTEPIAEIARQYDPDFAFVPAEAHYDGVYFYAIALDPLARGDVHSRIDTFEYRYGHPGYGWLALLAGVARAVRLRSPLDVLCLATAGLASLYTLLVLLYPKDLLRALVLQTLLLPAALGRVRVGEGSPPA